MARGEFQYLKSDIYEEEKARISKPKMESYDPDADDTFMPYLPSRGGQGNRYAPTVGRGARPGQFLDMNRIGEYSAPQDAQTTNQRYQQSVAQFEGSKGFQPNEDVAEKNLERMTDILKKTGGLIGSTTEDDQDLEAYATQVALKSLDECLSTLNDIEEWLPKGKQGYLKQLKTGAAPIVKALKVYRDAIQKIS